MVGLGVDLEVSALVLVGVVGIGVCWLLMEVIVLMISGVVLLFFVGVKVVVSC